MVMNCFPAHDNHVVQYLKSFFGEAKSIVNFQDRRLAWANKSIANCGGHPKSFLYMVRFELKIAVTLLLTEEKRKATFDSRHRLSIEEACGSFEKHLREGRSDGIFCHALRFMMMKIFFLRLVADLKSKSTSPIVLQIHFQNQFSWVKLLGVVCRGRSDGVATISIFEGKGTRQ